MEMNHTDNTQKKFAYFVAQKRKEQKLTQQQLADFAETNRFAIIRLENHTSKKISFGLSTKIIQALGYGLADFELFLEQSSIPQEISKAA